MSSTIVIHVLRPYANEEEYLAQDAFSIDAKSMLLIDQPPLPTDTAIIFDVQLQNGQKPIRAEARVIGPVPPMDGRPGGLRVRFKRFGAATKAFIDRAIALSRAAGISSEANGSPSLPPSLIPSRAPSRPEFAETTELEVVSSVRREPSGIHPRPARPIEAPANREELLERLRTRSRAAKPNVNASERAS